ncbi:MAG: hypothetical protein HOP23_00995 [Methylococcaceae bacterium]|nr:hypothetical protein [Methylococcaceae bacterium]
MEINDLQRHLIIKDVIAQLIKNDEDVVMNLWEPLATQIISIVGEGGFNSLFLRTIYLNQATFPWLAVSLLSTQTNQQLMNLKMNLDKQAPAQLCEANSVLLITLTDILASLIGEPLTIRILQLAWGVELLTKAGMEFNDE